MWALKLLQTHIAMPTSEIFASVLTVCLIVLLAACGSAPNEPGADAPQDASALALGETVYAANCASCHGAELEGEPDWKTSNADGTMKAPPHDESGHTWHHPDAYIRDRIVNGTNGLDAAVQAKSNMPAYGDTLSDVEIDAVIAYIKSYWSPRVQEMQSQR